MKKQLIPALLAAMFAFGGMSVYAADTSVPATAGGEATAKEPGRVNDPGSAEKKQTGTKKGVKNVGAHPGGAAPCTPAEQAKATGDVKCEPEKSAKKPPHQ